MKGFLRRIGKVSSLEAELWAIRDGLTLCTQLQTQELDAKAVISLVTCNKESFAQYALLIDDCRNMLQQHPLWKIQHCYREANTCADALAKKAVFSQLDFCILDTPPVELSQLLIQDHSGLFCNRICNYTALWLWFSFNISHVYQKKKIYIYIYKLFSCLPFYV